MLNKERVRELAYIVKVDEIRPIEGRDRVECAVVGGWTCMVRKDSFEPGDYGVYFEIDSKLPAKEPFIFLEPKKFKIKTQKYKIPNGQFWSQGLLMPFEDFIDCETGIAPKWLLSVNEAIYQGIDVAEDEEYKFLTKELEVTYADADDNKRKAKSADKYQKMAQRMGKKFAKQPYKWLMKRNWGKKLLFVFYGNVGDKKIWPVWVKKTDEERVENMSWIFQDKSEWVATEKIDGTSTTFTMKRKKKLFKEEFEFYVCSRNVVFDKPDKACFYDTNVYLEMAEKYNVERVLKDILVNRPDLEWVTLQGETYGEGIQKRDYGLKEHKFAGFNFITSAGGRWDTPAAAKLMAEYNIPWVPILDEHYVLPDTIEELREFVDSEKSKIDGVIKEGIVFRSPDGMKSFKCVSPSFLAKYHS